MIFLKISTAQRLPVRMVKTKTRDRREPVDRCGRIVQYQVHLIDIHDAIEVRGGFQISRTKEKGKKEGTQGKGRYILTFYLE